MDDMASRHLAQYRAAIKADNERRFAQANKNASRMQENKDRAASFERAKMIEKSRMDQLLARLASEERRQTQAIQARREEMLADGKLKRVMKNYGKGGGWVEEWVPR